jgi:hypothetical protein
VGGVHGSEPKPSKLSGLLDRLIMTSRTVADQAAEVQKTRHRMIARWGCFVLGSYPAAS